MKRLGIIATQIKDYIFEKLHLGKNLDQFYYVLGGHMFFQSLSSAVRYDLFTLIQKNPGITIGEICDNLRIQHQPARILLLNLVSSGLLIRKNDSFYNSKSASKFLVRGSKFDMSNIVLWQHFINYRAMFHFYESIQANSNVGLQVFPGTEKTLYERLHHSPELHKIFQNAMQEISAQANQELVDHIDLSNTKVLVDVGGGNGSNLIRLADKNAHLKGLLFDYPSACEIAKQNIEKHNMSHVISTVNGNCFADPFPASADSILFCHFFTIWSPEENQVLVKKSYEALPQKGRLFIFNMVQNDTEDGPLTAAIASPYFLTLATGKGMLYSAKEYKEWILKAGFSDVQVIRLPRDHVLITATK